MNSINAKSVQLIELHAFAYCLLSVSLSESFDFLEVSILNIIPVLAIILLSKLQVLKCMLKVAHRRGLI